MMSKMLIQRFRSATILATLLAGSALHADPGESPGEGLVSYWPFESSTSDFSALTTSSGGSVADDLSAQGGTARYVAGVVGEALAIGDVAGDPLWLNAPTSDDVILGPVYSIEAWVHPTLLDQSWQRLVLRWQGVLSYHFALRFIGGQWTVSLFHQQSGGANINADGGSVPLGEWSHIAGVADGEFLICYLDGEEVARAPYDGTINETVGAGLGLGDMATGNGLRFNGYVDELAIWELALDEEEILSHFLAGSDGYGLVFECDEEFDDLTVGGPADGSVGETSEVTATMTGVDDGQVASYSWELVSGDATLAGADTATVSVTPNAPGVVTVRVTVGDGLCDNELSAEHSLTAFEGVGESPAEGLVSYWSFEDTISDVASGVDQGGGESSDDLTPLAGGSRFVDGMVGRALAIGVEPGDATSFNGANTADVDLPEVYSIECWIYPTELADLWQRLVLRWGAGFSYHFAIRNNGGFINGVSLFHQQSNGVQINTNGGTVQPNRWQHIAGVADGEILRVYLDGQEVDSVAYDGTITQGITEGLGIGDSNTALSGIKYNGYLDELAIWNVALDPEHIETHYLAGPGGYGLGEGCPEDDDSVTVEGADVAFIGEPVVVTASFMGADPGSTVTYGWSLTGGSGLVEDNGDGTANVTCTEAGMITVEVEADDGVCPEDGPVLGELSICCEGRDVVTIDGPDGGVLGEEVTLTARFDGNDAGVEAGYEWELVAGVAIVNADGASLSVSCEELGEVVVRVTVSDGFCADGTSAEFTLLCALVDSSYRRADSNDDGRIDLSDGVFTLNYLFTGGPPPTCEDAANANGDARVDISDATFVFAFLFLGGPPPPGPGAPGDCQPVEPDLGCESYGSC